MPFCSTSATALDLTSSSLMSFPRFFLGQQLERLANPQPPGAGPSPAHVLEHALELAGHLLHARRRHDFDSDCRCAQLDLDLAFVELAFAKHLAEFLPGRGFVVTVSPDCLDAGACRSQQNVENPLLRCVLGPVPDLPGLPLPVELHRDVGEVANDGFDIAADVADLGELGGLDLDERSSGKTGEAASDLRLAHPGRPDHQDVLGSDLRTHLVFELHAPPPVAQCDRDRALGVGLTHDVLVQLVDDFSRRHVRHRCRSCLLQGVLPAVSRRCRAPRW